MGVDVSEIELRSKRHDLMGFDVSCPSPYMKENLESAAGHGCATKMSLRA